MTGYATGAANRMTNDGTYTYTYDAEGNRLTRSKGSGATLDLTTYTYDSLNHLIGVWQTLGGVNQVVVTYTYDVLGRRVQQDETIQSGATTTTRFAYDGQQVWADLTSGNVVQTRYLYGDGVDQVLARTDTTLGLSFYLTDHIGTVRALTDSSGVIQDAIDYAAFGAVNFETSATYGGHIKYTAREYDAATGLYFYRARFYDPVAGRFLSEDPSGFAAGDPDLYRYVSNFVTSATDPSGLEGEWQEMIRQYEQMARSPVYKETYQLAYQDIMLTAAQVGIADAWFAESFAKSNAHELAAAAYQVSLLKNVGLGGDPFRGDWKTVADGQKLMVGSGLRSGGNQDAQEGLGLGVDVFKQTVWVGVKSAASVIPGVNQAQLLGDLATAVSNGRTDLAMALLTLAQIRSRGSVQGAARNGTQAAKEMAVRRITNPAHSAFLQQYLNGSGGRWGSSATRQLNHRIATNLEGRGFRITGGAGRTMEEWIPGPGGSKKGGSFVDITATDGTRTIRIQTIDTLADGVTPTPREAAAAARIRAAFPDDQLILFPK
jgi:RHS repeat-associated protein